MTDLYNKYKKEIIKKLADELGLKNIMAVPRLVKIVINIGLGEALSNKQVLENMEKQLSDITGQKPVRTYSKKDISSFKLRRGDAIGLKVTLRSKKMYAFFEKLVKIVLPRIRDFRGVSRDGFDERGNYSLGIKEQIVFPEIEYSKIDRVRGMQINFEINTKDKDKSKKLLESLGMPFTKKT